MRALWRWLPLAALLALVVLFAASALRADRRLGDSPWIGRALPPVQTDGLNGHPVSLSGGGSYVLNIWASWCTPCLAEHPVLMAMQRDGVEVRGLIYKDTPAQAQQFLAQRGNPFRKLALDPKGEIALSLGVSGAPETFVIGPDGTVKLKIVGALDADLYTRIVRPALTSP